ncbi:ABC transporter permease [Labrys wisconsinensis]|uniref:Spermidine/putrescine transport system permease protein n=1 Tax=Labrys wisconsinensis TaxID=425677 RepID=A0ABU0J3L3_9HYPH|nr:ABC transporter permease [Labrys wisconsinensis]MDQ0468864.1 spermidine/putrescine transport system permease protein [Labrys wisconsinensis]
MGRLTRLAVFGLVMAGPILFVVVPIGAFLVMSFWRVENQQIVPAATLDNYAAFFGNWAYLKTFLLTLLLCAEVTAIDVLVGYPIAYFIWRRRGRSRYILLLLFVIPLFMSYIVKIYTMRSILGLNGFLNQMLVASGLLAQPSLLFLYNQTAILMTMAVIFLPFVILPIFLSLERIPRSLLQASSDLGAGLATTVRHVVLPLSLPGTIAGALFTFVLALGDYITPQMVGGPSGFTFGRVIWSQFGLAYNWPFGAAMGVVLFAVALVAIIGGGHAARRQRV